MTSPLSYLVIPAKAGTRAFAAATGQGLDEQSPVMHHVSGGLA